MVKCFRLRGPGLGLRDPSLCPEAWGLDTRLKLETFGVGGFRSSVEGLADKRLEFQVEGYVSGRFLLRTPPTVEVSLPEWLRGWT